MKKLLGAVVVASCVLASSVGLAGNTRIGVVDLQKIMQNSPQMKEIQANLEKNFKSRRDTLVAMEENIKKNMEEFKKDSAVLSPAKRKELEDKIVAEQQKLEQDGQKYQQELSTANNEAMEGFYNKIKAAIAKVAKDDKYDLVVQKDAAPFSQDALDVTNKVMKEIL